MTKISLYHSQL